MTPVVGSFNYTYNGSATLPTAPGTYSAVANFTSSDPNYWSWSDPQSGSGNTITVTIPDPTIPTNFTSTPVSTSQVTLSWNAAWEMDANLSSASSYEILSVHWQGHPGGPKAPMVRERMYTAPSRPLSSTATRSRRRPDIRTPSRR